MNGSKCSIQYNAYVTFDFRNDMTREEIIEEFKNHGINCDYNINTHYGTADYIDDSLSTVLDLVEKLVSKNESLHLVSCCDTCGKELTNIGGSQMYCHTCGTTKISCN